MKVLKFLAYVFLNLIYFCTNILWYFFYMFIFFGDYNIGKLTGFYLTEPIQIILAIFVCICFVWIVKLSLFPILYTLLNKIKIFKNFLNDLENNINAQNNLLQYGLIFDFSMLLVIIIHGLATTEKELIYSFFSCLFASLFLFGGGVFISYTGLVLWLMARKIKLGKECGV